jgi:RNA polymerase sigma-70 factor (ECF subfamily)
MALSAELELPRFIDSAALDVGALFADYGGQVLRWSKHLAGPTMDAEDIAQEVFYLAHIQRHSLRGRVSVASWLYRLTANVVARRRRKDRGWLRSALAFSEPVNINPATALDELEQEQRRHLIYAVLNSMRERDRTVLIAFAIEGLSGQAIADLFGVKIATIWTWLNRARLDFRRRLINRGLVPSE